MSDEFTFPKDKYLLIGKVAKVHGLKGQIKICSFSAQPENIESYRSLVFVTGDGQLSVPLLMVNCRVQKSNAIVSLQGVITREQAEKLNGLGVLIERDSLPPTDTDQFYYDDLIGLNVKLTNGEIVGTIESIFSNGAQDVLSITDGDQEYLIPVTEEFIAEINQEGVVITPPPGLLEINSGENEMIDE